ncbi:MAG: hypothetical protein SPD98_08340 [Tractidigestivibacter sp.]|uniref:hypothetical protein n=1 Tax=Tractidigestivibacter sp. TaxID=2847320 RepID=UPI002A810C41|nr:hypothetical protein [Tractidigestivibacter sp.]MDY4535239.1 hypothetical protein [Tractidigestivibacter sp.]
MDKALPGGAVGKDAHARPGRQDPDEARLEQMVRAMECLSEVQDGVRRAGDLTLADIESDALELGRGCPTELLELSDRIRQERSRLMRELEGAYDQLGRQSRQASAPG